MSMLDAHLEQIELCSQTILDLPFHQPKMFTNAVLYNNDITNIIRDPVYHEQALFTIADPNELTGTQAASDDPARQSAVFDINNEGLGPGATNVAPRKSKAITTVLGGDLADRLKRERATDAASSRRRTVAGREEIDIDLLLKGAEKLCAVYPMTGALERIAAVRGRFSKVMTSIQQYEELVENQASRLRSMNQPTLLDNEDVEDDTFQDIARRPASNPALMYEDILREEESIKELERRKKTLEDRVSGMEKDLGGILR